MPLILFGVVLNTGAQLLLKAGVNRMGQFDFVWAKIVPLGLQIATNPYILIGLFSYVISVGTWLLVLSRVDVSYAYPMISLGYVLNAVTAYYLFDETLSISRMMGIFVILCGVYLVARS
ncbi:MAG: EamA family transporter [Gammaproteobacteria bacterium]|nr:EamA family transporter [Gammaproteobacteria bacterium]